MCGIAGIVSKDKVNVKDIQSMTSALDHRGPDAKDHFISETGTHALGHTRLSIIDLSSAANQPLHSADGRFTIVFNGEIYNFRALRKELEILNPEIKFATHSDTEIIINGFARWGAEVCLKLDGMFAFAIYDHLENRIFLCRDRLGKKPIFYFANEEHFVFASEIKSLLKYPALSTRKNINKNAIQSFLHLGYIPEPDTIFSSIKKFPAGHFCVVDAGLQCQFSSYWSVTDVVNSVKKIDQDPVSLLRPVLINAVEKRLISDVPLGAFLSGGTDSSLVVAIASKLKDEPLKTFAIGFKESKFNESIFASKVAAKLGTDHHEYELAEEEAVDILETYIKHFDEPFADTSAIPTLLISRLARKEVTVALTGDGGDELFSGYGSYDWANRLEYFWLQAVQSPLSLVFRHFGNNRLKRISYLLEKVPKENRRTHIFSQEQYFFSRQEIQQKLMTSPTPFFNYIDSVLNNVNAAEKQALFDLQYYLRDDLLVKVDRASMFYGLECRSPLLDQKVVELALNLPYGAKRNEGQRKWILKELLKEYLPEDLINRPKWGFSVPLAKWLQNQLAFLIERYLNREMIESIGVVQFSYVDEIKKSFSEGNTFLYNRLWVLIILHKWLYENG
jgi:asparagine synthase (glutamine-hydrolysing)